MWLGGFTKTVSEKNIAKCRTHFHCMRSPSSIDIVGINCWKLSVSSACNEKKKTQQTKMHSMGMLSSRLLSVWVINPMPCVTLVWAKSLSFIQLVVICRIRPACDTISGYEAKECLRFAYRCHRIRDTSHCFPTCTLIYAETLHAQWVQLFFLLVNVCVWVFGCYWRCVFCCFRWSCLRAILCCVVSISRNTTINEPCNRVLRNRRNESSKAHVTSHKKAECTSCFAHIDRDVFIISIKWRQIENEMNTIHAR